LKKWAREEKRGRKIGSKRGKKIRTTPMPLKN
jgi:hypothetical protein